MILQIVIGVLNERVLYPTNLPNGLYEFRLTDITYIDALVNTNHSLCTVQSDCWRIPFGNISRGNTLYFYNKLDNGRCAPQGTWNFLAEIRNQSMDIVLTGAGGSFTACILTFDVSPSDGKTFFGSWCME
jgi:hypothetical protein